MKRFGILFVAGAVLLASAGCGDGASSADSGNAPPPPPTDYEKLFKKPDRKKGAGAAKGAFLVEPGSRQVRAV